MQIPLAKPDIGEEEVALVCETLRSGWITQGPRVIEFEKAFAAYVGAEHAVAVSSCTTALHLALHTGGVGFGDEVITPTHSFIATANAIRYCGARPVFVDIEAGSLNMNPSQIAGVVTARTKAIVVVHQVGRPADLERIGEVAERLRLRVVEDAACAIGSQYHGRRIGGGAHSAATCFSFHPRKIISTGDGGMITTRDPQLAQRLRELRQHGMSLNDLQRHQSRSVMTESYRELGFNYRMTDLQAALGVGQLAKLPAMLARRRELADRYQEKLSGARGVTLFHEPSDVRWNHQTYLVRVAASVPRDRLMQGLLDRGVATRRGIMSIHREPAYVSEYGDQRFPESERASDECLCLPLYSQMTFEEQDFVVRALLSLLA